MTNPNLLFDPLNTPWVQRDNKLTPIAWSVLQGLKVGLSTIDLTDQVSGILGAVNGGTGVNNGARTLTLNGASLTLTMTAPTSVTLPTSGTLFAQGGALTASSVTASGTVQGGTVTSLGNVQGATVTATGNVSAANVVASGTVSAATMATSGNAHIAGNLTVDGILTPGVQSRKVTPTTITNSNAETALHTYTVPGGTLGTNRILHISGTGTITQGTGAAQNITFRVKYGGTIVANLNFSNVPPYAAGILGPWSFDCEIAGAGATNAQTSKCIGAIAFNSGLFTGTGSSFLDLAATNIVQSTAVLPSVHASVAVDSTVSQPLVVTGILGVAQPTISITLSTAYVEVK
jgi:hypothetical protein